MDERSELTHKTLASTTLIDTASWCSLGTVIASIRHKCIDEVVRTSFDTIYAAWLEDTKPYDDGKRLIGVEYIVHRVQEEHLRGSDRWCYALVLTKPDKRRTVWKFDIEEGDRLSCAVLVRNDEPLIPSNSN